MDRSLSESQEKTRHRLHLVMPAVGAAILVVAAWLRWRYIIAVQPYPDEFVTMLAVQMTLQKGAPILPSGLFYEHGLLFSYVAAAASWLFGFSRQVIRLTSLFFGLLTVIATWYIGRRRISPLAGLFGAAILAVAPAAVLWAGRARMYAMLQFWVLLVVFFALKGTEKDRPGWRWLALGCYLAAATTQFVSVALAPPLVLGLLGMAWLSHSRWTVPPARTAKSASERRWFARREIWLEALGWIAVLAVAFLLKRMGQPKGIEPLSASAGGIVAGVGQVLAIYGALPANIAESWRAVAPFFLARETLVLTCLAAVAVVAAAWRWVHARLAVRDRTALFFAWLLFFTTAEMVFLVSPDRRDDKYLFMLLPLLCLLAADGVMRLIGLVHHKVRDWRVSGRPRAEAKEGEEQSVLWVALTVLAAVAVLAGPWSASNDMLAQPGSDYDTAFNYVKEHWQPGDAVLTGTPAAAAIYLGRNDYYAVRGTEGYAYRILEKGGQLVDRWMGSPWLETDEQLQAVLSGPRRVWLVLERWGLILEYYSPLTMQRILAMTDFVREDNGIIVLQSRPGSRLIPAEPRYSAQVNFDDKLLLQGYDVRETDRRHMEIVLYWQALAPLGYDYSVFVHLRNAAGDTVAQADHLPLAPIYPPTLWPVGETVREQSLLVIPEDVPGGVYDLWVGVYRLDTLERLPIVGDASGENAALLGSLEVN